MEIVTGEQMRRIDERAIERFGVPSLKLMEAAGREAQALEKKDWEGALYCQKMEKKFINDHLIKWIPSFCDKIIAQSELSFYGDLAEVTKEFIALESEEIDVSISTTKRHVN